MHRIISTVFYPQYCMHSIIFTQLNICIILYAYQLHNGLYNPNDMHSIVYMVLYPLYTVQSMICIVLYVEYYMNRIICMILYSYKFMQSIMCIKFNEQNAHHSMELYTINSITYTEYSIQNILCIIFYA